MLNHTGIGERSHRCSYVAVPPDCRDAAAPADGGRLRGGVGQIGKFREVPGRRKAATKQHGQRRVQDTSRHIKTPHSPDTVPVPAIATPSNRRRAMQWWSLRPQIKNRQSCNCCGRSVRFRLLETSFYKATCVNIVCCYMGMEILSTPWAMHKM